jgi:hypothetical protein
MVSFAPSHNGLNLDKIINFSTFFTLAYMSSPAHVELFAEEKAEDVAKATEEKTVRFTRKQIARGHGKTVAVGGDN